MAFLEGEAEQGKIVCDELLKLETAQLKKMNLKEAQRLGGGAHEVD